MSTFQEILNCIEESSSDSFSTEVTSSESTSIEMSSSESISIATSSPEFDRIEVRSLEHFDKFYNAEGDLKCKCKYCSREFYCDSRKNGTSSLKNHMGRCKRGPYKEDKTQALVNLRPDSMGHEGEMMGTAADLRFDQRLSGRTSKRAFKAFEVHDPRYRMELESTDGKGTPTDEDWKKVEMLLDFCEFFVLKLAHSQSSDVRPYSFFEFNLMISVNFRKWNGKDDVQFKGMVERLEDKYHKYWNKSYEEYFCCTGNMNLLVSVAAVLDPRKKLEKVELELSERFTTRRLRKKVRKITYDLYNGYEGKSTPHVGKTSDRMRTSGETDHMPEEFRMSTKSQLDNGGRESISKLDRFPVLSQIARDVLAVPINAVPHEYACSTEGFVLGRFRSSLTPKLLQAVICTENWLQPSRMLVDVKEDFEELN
uniref:Zinc finger BED domain-containing protein RICESLEEPER 2-like n=1 Tax=Ananas comosus var. bracteatus TaxID=296719 RepID=A0A6V7PV27_ANACO|nr:unnamed protein product [Ananas comosus var. bracteatus]